MKICPECGGIAFYNSYFGAYFCNSCNWKLKVSNKPRQTSGKTFDYRTIRKKDEFPRKAKA